MTAQALAQHLVGDHAPQGAFRRTVKLGRVLASCSCLAAVAACSRTLGPSATAGDPQALLPDSEAKQITLTYICGSSFRVRNPHPSVQTVEWDVDGKNERGELLLAPRGSGTAYSETHFTTATAGTVRLFYGGRLIQTKANGGTPQCTLPTTRPAIPDSLRYPADVDFLLTTPLDSRFVYYRRLFTLRFVDGASDSSVVGFFREFKAVAVAGSPELKVYIIQVPDPGSLAADHDALLTRMNNWRDVEVAAPVLAYGPKAPSM